MGLYFYFARKNCNYAILNGNGIFAYIIFTQIHSGLSAVGCMQAASKLHLTPNWLHSNDMEQLI